ncbi:MAG: cobyrinic acid a,c-diamide synthase [Thauera phenolivorans]|uniref:Cobyrinic acid a,c-diamide synthase n=1 Tax=Thauera phenolivorans TaxID=1792543 RepID=A0A7X7R6L0_9RHOO|nr:cobyrinic acid a,c-diamide synthase [Thauera phenolivorans]
MFEFLQGLAFGLLMSCPPWFMAGMFDPRLATPEDLASRWQVILRYGFAVPLIGMLLFMTSLWGGFGASLAGWLAGLAAVPLELFVERRWLRWRRGRAAREQSAVRQRELARRAAECHESHLLTLDPARAPGGGDELVLGLWQAKRELVALRRPDLAVQADRLYTRYDRALTVLGEKFDTREVTFERARGLVGAVSRGGLEALDSMVSLAGGSAAIDTDFVRRRLEREGAALPIAEREALRHRLALAEDTERRLSELGARHEAALTALDDVVVAVARIETGRPQAGIATEQALTELRRFAERAGLYGRKA